MPCLTVTLDVLSDLSEAISGRPALEVLDAVAQEVQEAQTLLVGAHVNPDGDAVGSEVALALGLRSLGKEVRVINGDPTPSKFVELLPEGVVEVLADSAAVALIPPVDLCVLLDTSEPARAGICSERFFAAEQRRVCLDHHLCPSPVDYSAHLVLPQAPSTGNLVLALLDRLGVALTAEIAQALWIALATDTGWFRFPNATPWAFQDAGRLVAAGVDLEASYDRIYMDFSAARARVQGAALSGLEVEFDGRFVWSHLSHEMLEREGVSVGELDGIVDALKAVGGASIVAFLVEVAPNEQKISLRARGAVDVEPIARRFGGGGHAKAAGCRFHGSREEVVARLSAFVGEALH